MKKCALFLGLGILFAGCSHEEYLEQLKKYDVTNKDRVSYAESNLGVKIDPNQDWILTKKYSVKVTADANLDNIKEVMVLSGNPYAGVTYRLVRLELTNGGNATLDFTAPLSSTVLYAACLSAQNECIARPFRPGTDASVSFIDNFDESDSAEPAGTRGGVADVTTVTQINDKWQEGSRLFDLPGMQAEVQAFIPSGKDNRNQIAPIHSCTIWAKGQPMATPSQHIVLNYISGSPTNQNTHVGYQVRLRYDNPQKLGPETYLLIDDINPNSFYTYEPPQYRTVAHHLRHKNYDNPESTQLLDKFSDRYEVKFFECNGTNMAEADTARAIVFKVNNHGYLALESSGNWDYNDKVFLLWENAYILNSIPDAGVKPQPSTPQIFTYAWEDKDYGDYDMNDCVIQVQENANDASKLDITLVALGGARNLWLGFENKNAKSYKDYKPVFDKELHEVFGVKPGTMVNTGKASASPVTITVAKPSGFDFQTCSFVLGAKFKEDQQGIYESDFYYISIATKGQDPHGICIPGKWSWPTETTKITEAYPKFAEWAKDVTNKDAQDWYNYPVPGKVVTQ